MPRYKRPRYPYPQLVKDIAKYGVSESAVRTVLKYFCIVVTRQVSKGNQITLPRLGSFYLKKQRIHYRFNNRGHSKEETYITHNPHFTCDGFFKNVVQTLNGQPTSFCHRSAEAQSTLTLDLSPYMDEEDTPTDTPSSSPGG